MLGAGTINVLILYDSWYGTGQQVAESLEETLKRTGANVEAHHIKKFKELGKQGAGRFDLFIFGTPTHGSKPTRRLLRGIRAIGAQDVKGKKYTTYATMMTVENYDGALPALNAAAEAIGLVQLVPGTKLKADALKGPLAKGELKRIKALGEDLFMKMIMV